MPSFFPLYLPPPYTHPYYSKHFRISILLAVTADRKVYANINITAFTRPYHWPNVIELIILYRILLKLIGTVKKLK